MPHGDGRSCLLPTGSLLFFIFVTHTHDMLFFFSLLIRAAGPDSGWLTKEIKMELIPWGTLHLRSKSVYVASCKCNPTACTSQLPDTGTKDNKPYKSVVVSPKGSEDSEEEIWRSGLTQLNKFFQKSLVLALLSNSNFHTWQIKNSHIGC